MPGTGHAPSVRTSMSSRHSGADDREGRDAGGSADEHTPRGLLPSMSRRLHDLEGHIMSGEQSGERKRERREREKERLLKQLRKIQMEEEEESGSMEDKGGRGRKKKQNPLKSFRKTMKRKKYAKILEKLQAVQDERSEEEQKAVHDLRAALEARDLLPPHHNEYHELLR